MALLQQENNALMEELTKERGHVKQLLRSWSNNWRRLKTLD
jgi:hypothetical protein